MFVTETTIKSCLLYRNYYKIMFITETTINHVYYRNYYKIMFVTETTIKSCLLQKLL